LVQLAVEEVGVDLGSHGAGGTASVHASTGAWSFTSTRALTDRTYTISVSQSDAAGNAATPTTGTVLVDTVAPSVLLTAPTSPRKVNKPPLTDTAGTQPANSTHSADKPSLPSPPVRPLAQGGPATVTPVTGARSFTPTTARIWEHPRSVPCQSCLGSHFADSRRIDLYRERWIDLDRGRVRVVITGGRMDSCEPRVVGASTKRMSSEGRIMYVSRLFRAATCAVAVGTVLGITGASTPASAAPVQYASAAPVQYASAAPVQYASAAPVQYYVSVGDSLSVGVQPTGPNGQEVSTDQGYSDQLYKIEKLRIPNLQLIKLGCSGETTTTMIHGGLCHYDAGSQLSAAFGFLAAPAHRGHIAFVTIDIGANDVDSCISRAGIDPKCVTKGVTSTARNLPMILRTLRAAAPGTPVVGMTYYDPFLAAWLAGPAGQIVARESVKTLTDFNALLTANYAALGMPVADVARTFLTSDFFSIFGLAPLNVAVICTSTWMCAAPPQGPNIHANARGYAAIAVTFAAVLHRALHSGSTPAT
jgi:lysophospholipase L1-like esterase